MRMVLFPILILFFASFCNSQICYWGKYDIIFLTDATGSVSNEDWDRQKQFVASFIELLHIDYFFVRAGIVQFGGTGIASLNLTHSYSKAVEFANSDQFVRDNKANIPKPGYDPHTYLNFGLEGSYDYIYAYGTRNVQKVIIALTDGGTALPDEDTIQADKFKNEGGLLFVIGVGSSVNSNHLQTLGNEVDYYNHVDNFGALEEITDLLTSKLPCGLNPVLNFIVWLPVGLIAACILLTILALLGGVGLLCLQKYVPPLKTQNNTEKSMYYVAGKQMGISWGDKGLGMDSMYRPGDMGMGDQFGASKRTKFEGLKAKRESITNLDVMDPRYKGKKKKKCTIL